MTVILGIESSCDDTSAAILKDGLVLSNVIASQKVHEAYGGVVPELASRAHQQNIIPVVSEAIKRAGIEVKDIDAVAFTRGPGLLGSLLVGTSFAKGFALANHLPMIEVNHLQAHILANFIKEPGVESRQPPFPFSTLKSSKCPAGVGRKFAVDRCTRLPENGNDRTNDRRCCGGSLRQMCQSDGITLSRRSDYRPTRERR